MFLRPAVPVLRLLAASLVALTMTVPLSGCFGQRIKELKAQRNTAEARVMALRQDLDATQENLQEAQVSIRRLEQQNTDREARIDALTKQLAETEDKLKTAQALLNSTTNSQARELSERMNAMMKAEETARLEVERLEAALDELRLERMAEEEELTELRQVAKEREEAIERNKTVIAELQRAVSTQQEVSARNATEIKTLTDQLTENKTQMDALNSTITERDSRITLETEKSAALQSNIELLRTQIATLETENKNAKEAARPRVSSERVDALESSARSSVRGSGVSFVRREDGLTMRMPTDTLFTTGTTQLTAEAEALLKTVADFLRNNSYERIDVIGHTDNTPIRNLPYPDNWELASARANEVLRWLAAQNGIDRARLHGISRSFHDPVGDNGTPEGRRANRRVEIRIVLPAGN